MLINSLEHYEVTISPLLYHASLLNSLENNGTVEKERLSMGDLLGAGALPTIREPNAEELLALETDRGKRNEPFRLNTRTSPR